MPRCSSPLTPLSACRMVCVYLVLQLVIAVIIENIETLEKIENMKVSQKHIQVCGVWGSYVPRGGEGGV